jgi:hypothetical protein
MQLVSILNRRSALTVALVVLCCAALAAQSSPILTPIAHPEEYLRNAYYQGDEELITRDGRALAEAPDALPETRAWYYLTRYGIMLPEGLAIVDRLRKDAPDDPWTLALRAFSTRDIEQSIALCQRAWAKGAREDRRSSAMKAELLCDRTSYD